LRDKKPTDYYHGRLVGPDHTYYLKMWQELVSVLCCM